MPDKKLRRNNKELRRLERIAQKNRDSLERTAPNVYTDLSQAYLTPRGYPTLEEFAVMREAQNAYREAHPLQGATDIYTMGPVAYERWLGSRNSADGKNYRLPYLAERTVSGGGSKMGMGGLPEVEGTNVKNFYDVPPMAMTGMGGNFYAPTWQANRNMKPAHAKEKRNRSLLSQIAHTPGSILPATNYLFGGGASTGGNRIMDALMGLGMYSAFQGWKKRGQNRIQSGSTAGNQLVSAPAAGFAGIMSLDSAATAAAISAMYGLNGHELVIPTSGLTVNPFNKQARILKREGRKDVKQAKGYARASDKKIKQLQAREAKKTDNLIRLYEKQYGVTPQLNVPASSTVDPYGRR